jgi:hypothetical protein
MFCYKVYNQEGQEILGVYAFNRDVAQFLVSQFLGHYGNYVRLKMCGWFKPTWSSKGAHELSGL